MDIVNLKDLKGFLKAEKVEAKKIPTGFSAQCVNIVLQPGGNLPVHTTPVDVIFYVLKGTGTVEIGEEKKEVSEGMFIESPRNILHGWSNFGKEELSVLVIKLM